MRISDMSSEVYSSDLHQPDIRTILHPPHIALPLGPRLLRWLNRKGSGIATPGAVIAERAKRAQRIACGADRRAQIHHRLRKIPSARLGRDPVRSSAYIEIGRASCRERVCRYVLISGVAGSLKKKT